MRTRKSWIKHLWPATLVLMIELFLWSQPLYAQGPEWTWQNPHPQGHTLHGVWGSSGSDVYAVGLYGTILYYDGSTWSSLSSGTTNNL